MRRPRPRVSLSRAPAHVPIVPGSPVVTGLRGARADRAAGIGPARARRPARISGPARVSVFPASRPAGIPPAVAERGPAWAGARRARAASPGRVRRVGPAARWSAARPIHAGPRRRIIPRRMTGPGRILPGSGLTRRSRRPSAPGIPAPARRSLARDAAAGTGRGARVHRRPRRGRAPVTVPADGCPGPVIVLTRRRRTHASIMLPSTVARTRRRGLPASQARRPSGTASRREPPHARPGQSAPARRPRSARPPSPAQPSSGARPTSGNAPSAMISRNTSGAVRFSPNRLALPAP